MSPTLTEVRPVAVANLLLDEDNPRVDPQNGQRDAIRAIVQKQENKIVNLAADIVANGLSAAELFMAIPLEGDDKHFITVDGNRRLTALRLLNEPDLANGVLGPKALQRLKDLADEFELNPTTTVLVVIYPDRQSSDIWVERRHQVDLDGVGQESWGANEKQRFAKRRGHITPTMQVLDFVREHGNLTEEELEKIKSLYISNLTRIINDKYIREKLGLRLEDGKFLSSFTMVETLKPLKKIVLDVATKAINVTQLENSKQRKEYIDKFSTEHLPSAQGRQATEKPLLRVEPTAKPNVDGKPTTGPDGPTSKRPAVKRERVTLIPRECALYIEDDRIKAIYLELKRLNAEELPNSAAVLFRVFLELSLDDFVEHHHIIASAQERRNTKLANKLTKVADWMRDQNLMTDQELAPVRRAASDSNMLAASITTLHQYVHNRHFSPIPSELKTSWNDLQPFMEKVWATRP